MAQPIRKFVSESTGGSGAIIEVECGSEERREFYWLNIPAVKTKQRPGPIIKCHPSPAQPTPDTLKQTLRNFNMSMSCLLSWR